MQVPHLDPTHPFRRQRSALGSHLDGIGHFLSPCLRHYPCPKPLPINLGSCPSQFPLTPTPCRSAPKKPAHAVVFVSYSLTLRAMAPRTRAAERPAQPAKNCRFWCSPGQTVLRGPGQSPRASVTANAATPAAGCHRAPAPSDAPPAPDHRRRSARTETRDTASPTGAPPPPSRTPRPCTPARPPRTG